MTAVCLATILHFQPAYVHLLSGVLLMCACITHLQSYCFAQGGTLSCNGSLMMTLEAFQHMALCIQLCFELFPFQFEHTCPTRLLQLTQQVDDIPTIFVGRSEVPN